MLAALGARFLDASGASVGPGGAALARLAKADLSDLDPRLAEVDLVLASDVDNPLLRPKGAAAVYGPQKGAPPKEVDILEDALRHYARTCGALGTAGEPGAGAADGPGFGARTALRARFRPGKVKWSRPARCRRRRPR
ncbi:hypothetical protein GCM10009574_070840 [Streptomyces asiaticus]